MSDDAEERRQQDLRDLEFYSQRVRPTVSDLLRTNELSRKNNRISLSADKSRERSRDGQRLRMPASLADIYADSRFGAERPQSEERHSAATIAWTEVVWMLFAVAIVLGLWAGDVDLVIRALVF